MVLIDNLMKGLSCGASIVMKQLSFTSDDRLTHSKVGTLQLFLPKILLNSDGLHWIAKGAKAYFRLHVGK